MLHLATTTDSQRMHNIHWNASNPLFRIDRTDNVIDINGGNHAWEYDQVNIVCPVYKPGVSESLQEKYIIYSVTKEEYDSCRITQPNPKIIAVCNRPHELMYFPLTFRSFTPTPGGLEFRPGQDYYFVSTSSKLDIHRRVGGYCATHNMRIVFRVAEREEEEEGNTTVERAPAPTPKNFWTKWWNLKAPKKDVEEELSNYVDVDSLGLYERHPKSFRSEASPLQSSSKSISSSSTLPLLLFCTIYISNLIPR